MGTSYPVAGPKRPQKIILRTRKRGSRSRPIWLQVVNESQLVWVIGVVWAALA